MSTRQDRANTGVHAAFLEEDEAPKLKLTKLDSSDDGVARPVPYERTVYTKRGWPRQAAPADRQLAPNNRQPSPADRQPVSADRQPAPAHTRVSRHHQNKTERKLSDKSNTNLKLAPSLLFTNSEPANNLAEKIISSNLVEPPDEDNNNRTVDSSEQQHTSSSENNAIISIDSLVDSENYLKHSLNNTELSLTCDETKPQPVTSIKGFESKFVSAPGVSVGDVNSESEGAPPPEKRRKKKATGPSQLDVVRAAAQVSMLRTHFMTYLAVEH